MCFDTRDDACTVRQVLDRVGGKWSIGILVTATRGPVRFTELERSIEGISRRMLTLTLRNLERDGLLRRTVYPTVPPKVEYEATAMARELYDALTTLTTWAERHRAEIATRPGRLRPPGGDVGLGDEPRRVPRAPSRAPRRRS